ncbi:uncharacterized protein LOC109852047 isoform X3 [Pseudomyrmex gracilis]|uniref:uncharacterized protein LOC109852047 isoform X3 n=1 Tax=Pseudomyrmex gracilis TaxID=219809 RepID=UPI0009950141|nr:uncharacterized protein LOC109852047 isoform X3 [Pseudomyrmex gracilis]
MEESTAGQYSAEREKQPVDSLGVYEGERNDNGERHGSGKTLLPNGDVYVGEYRNGFRHGVGTYVFGNGARYNGDWRQGRKYGQGSFWYPDGTRYEGEWKRDAKHGFGVYYYANNDIYEGSWERDLRHGLGTYVYADTGTKFMGTWTEDRMQGPGQLVHPRHCFHGFWKLNLEVGTKNEKSPFLPKDVLPIWRARCITPYNPELLPPEAIPLSEQMRTLDTIMNSTCAYCTLEPPPDILHIPPPPFPAILQQGSDFYSSSDILTFPPHLNDSPCKHFCDRRSEGVQYIEMPQQGTVFDDTWLLVLIMSCISVIVIGILLVTLLLKCKFNRNGKSGVISMPNTASGIQTKNGRLQNEAVLYPCAADTMQDSRVMWATLTPRGTTRHYLEEHTYETIGGGQFHKRACTTTPTEHVKLKTYADPPAVSPVHNRPKDEKAFDNTAFVDYEEPLSIKTEYYQLNDVLEPNESGILTIQRGTLRPRVSSPTRIEHPNLPPLNLHPHKHGSRKNSGTQHTSDTLLRSSITSSTYIPTI